MKKPAEFLQGFGIGAGLIAAVAAISLLFRPGLLVPGQTHMAPSGKPIVEPRSAGQTTTLLPQDYLDLCRNAGL
ncbi:MAG TPA: hypothetical protein VEO02_12195 [Thermoanaerobaculia bacterium]|nr:hypothetical protein [Thermoanaerobaculia bacterium]